MADWAMLPSAIIGTITGFLGLEDHARMGAVCRLWRLAMADSFSRRPPVPTVWLINGPQGEFGGQGKFDFPGYSLGKRRNALRITVEASSQKICVGSSKGLLMLADNLSRLQAFNPITKTSLWFPQEYPFAAEDPTFTYVTWKSSYRKAIVVPPRGGRGGDDSVVVAILRRGDQYLSEVAFAVAGDSSWTELRGSTYWFDDIAAHDGKLYALGQDSSFPRVYVWDLGYKPRWSPVWPSAEIELPPGWRNYWKRHLGVMSGELILLWWDYCFQCPIRRLRCVPSFRVQRLQRSPRQEWIEIEDLGGHAIVLGADGITVVPADESRWLWADCIYSSWDPPGYEGYPPGLTVFNLANGRVAFESISVRSSSAFWFEPTLASPQSSLGYHAQQRSMSF